MEAVLTLFELKNCIPFFWTTNYLKLDLAFFSVVEG